MKELLVVSPGVKIDRPGQHMMEINKRVMVNFAEWLNESDGGVCVCFCVRY